MMLPELILKKNEEKRIRSGHPWVYSNEINTSLTPLKNFLAGDEVVVKAHDQSILGVAYINPHSLITARLFTTDRNQRLDGHFFKEKITAALELRDALFNEPYYRLIFSEADALPGLVVDRFAEDFVIQVNTAGMEQKIEIIAQAFLSVFPAIHSIFLRNDSAIRKQEGLELYTKPLYGVPPDEIKVIENGIPFLAPHKTGQQTGWFYDHRMNRARLKDYVKDKNALDVFSYVGGFGIEAAVFGAKEVDCIESSETACRFIEKNAILNQVNHQVNVIRE